MKLIISKIEENGKKQLKVSFNTSNGEETFEYIKMIEHLYLKPDEKIELEYTDDVTEEEQEKIQELFDEITEVAKKDNEPLITHQAKNN